MHHPNPIEPKMSPKYVLVLLLALVFAATSFASYPKPPHKYKPPTDHELSLEEQEKWHVNANLYNKPPFHNHKPPTTLQNELSVPNTEHKPPVNNQPKPPKGGKKPPHGPGHPPVEENEEEDKYKPPKKKPPVDAYRPPYRRPPRPPPAN